MDTINVNELVLDNTLNPRLKGTNSEIVEYYAEIFDDVIWPPILVHRESLKLIDGFHRVAAAKKVGKYNFFVQYLENIAEEELFAYAVKANLGHGANLSKEERYKAIHKLQRAGWTNEKIAELLNCGITTVNKTEEAENLRNKFRMTNYDCIGLETESLIELIKVPQYSEDIAEIAVELDSTPTDVRRAVKAVKNEVIEGNDEIKQALLNNEFVKHRLEAKKMRDGNWLTNFAELVDKLEAASITSVREDEKQAAINIYTRVRDWSDKQIAILTDNFQKNIDF